MLNSKSQDSSLFTLHFSLFSSVHGDEGHEHFFHGDAAVLEGVFVVTHVVVIVVGVGEE